MNPALTAIDRQLANLTAERFDGGAQSSADKQQQIATLQAERRRILGPVGVEADFIITLANDLLSAFATYEGKRQLIDGGGNPRRCELEAERDALQQMVNIAPALRDAAERLREAGKAELGRGLRRDLRASVAAGRAAE